MKKFFLVIFILLDVLIIAASAWFLFVRMNTKNPTMADFIPNSTSKPSAAARGGPSDTSNAAAGTDSGSAASGLSPTPTTPISPTSRKILFSYRNSKARKVMIRADFTGWRAEPMQKDAATSIWTYMGVLEPGEYAYCYSVDDKSIRDPANKRTKQVGKTIVSSIIVQPVSR